MQKNIGSLALTLCLLLAASTASAADHTPSSRKALVGFGAALVATGGWLWRKSVKKEKAHVVPEPEIYQIQRNRRGEIAAFFGERNIPAVLAGIVSSYDEGKTFELVHKPTHSAQYPQGTVHVYKPMYGKTVLTSITIEPYDTFDSIQEKIAAIGFPVEKQKLSLSGKPVTSIEDLGDLLAVGSLRIDA